MSEVVSIKADGRLNKTKTPHKSNTNTRERWKIVKQRRFESLLYSSESFVTFLPFKSDFRRNRFNWSVSNLAYLTHANIEFETSWKRFVHPFPSFDSPEGNWKKVFSPLHWEITLSFHCTFFSDSSVSLFLSPFDKKKTSPTFWIFYRPTNEKVINEKSFLIFAFFVCCVDRKICVADI